MLVTTLAWVGALGGGWTRVETVAQAPVLRLDVAMAPLPRPMRIVIRENEMATVQPQDGTSVGLKGRIVDTARTTVVVTLYDQAQEDHVLGTVSLKSGGPAVTSRTDPAVTIKLIDVR